MDRKKELKQLYKEIEIKAGIYQIKNIENEKIFVGSTRNLENVKWCEIHVGEWRSFQ